MKNIATITGSNNKNSLRMKEKREIISNAYLQTAGIAANHTM